MPVPIAAYAEIAGDEIYLRGLVGRVDGSEIITGEIRGNNDNADVIGLQLAETLLQKGADRILRELINGN